MFSLVYCFELLFGWTCGPQVSMFLIGSILHGYICQLWKRIVYTQIYTCINVSCHWQFSIDIVVDLGHKVTERLKERQKKFQRQKSFQIDPHLSELPGTYWNKFYKNRESVQLNQWVLTYFTKISSSEFHFKEVFVQYMLTPCLIFFPLNVFLFTYIYVSKTPKSELTCSEFICFLGYKHAPLTLPITNPYTTGFAPIHSENFWIC